MMKFNTDIKTRDKIIFGNYDPEKYLGGIRSFNGLPWEKLQLLVDMDFADPEEAQNDSPTIQEFIDFAKARPGYTLNGYAVADTRADYRVSIEAIEHEGEFETKEELIDFVDFARSADEFEAEAGYAWWD